MRTFLFTRPRGNSLYFLHGELLCQGVSRAVLLASAKTHKKLRPRKQRTYRRSSLRGDFAFPAGCPRRPCPCETIKKRFRRIRSYAVLPRYHIASTWRSHAQSFSSGSRCDNDQASQSARCSEPALSTG